MIELKNIKKIYKSKKGTNTYALKGINLKFENKGLTFILGKSGSGKSTLLNIIGGLDTYTSGDIIIGGKSTKKFKSSDWDAYRNTYMGFVFQEFNLIEKYNIYENIKLSLDLQNKKISKEEIINILNKVGLDDVLKRKPNELSGGQKQRIAIARALIKSPKIIIADEPTGNLDSATSIQIYELLKELSKEKLVIVVTHDEDSANKFGDRIIRISDGVISGDSKIGIKTDDVALRLQKAKLPLKYKFKMGFGNLFHKKIKLLFSICLISLCLVCLGITFSATSLDLNEEQIKAVIKNDDGVIYINNYKQFQDVNKMYQSIYSGNEYNYMNNQETLEVDDKLFNEVEEKTKLKWYKEINITQDFVPINMIFANENNQILYYKNTLAPIFVEIYLDDEISNLIGNMPKESDEIVISSYFADNIIKNGIYTKKNSTREEDIYRPSSYAQIINDNKYFNLGNFSKMVKIAGIVNYNMDKYNDLKITTNDELDEMNYNGYYYDLSNLINDLESTKKYYYVYMSKDFLSNQGLRENNILYSTTKLRMNDNISIIDNVSYLLNNIEYYDGNKIIKDNNINTDEIVINLNILNDITNNDYSKKLNEYIGQVDDEFMFDQEGFAKDYIKNNNIIGKVVKYNINNNRIVDSLENYREYKIKGVVVSNCISNNVYIAKDNIIEILPKVVSVKRIFTEVKDEGEIRNIFRNYPTDGAYVISSTKYSSRILSLSLESYMINLVGKYGSMFFIVLSTFIIINIISTSIAFRKKEMGILRALGCKSKDILGMFILEVIILISLCITIANYGINIIVIRVNTMFYNILNSDVNLLSYGVNQKLLLVMSIVLIALISSVIPLSKIVRNKPIDTINNK